MFRQAHAPFDRQQRERCEPQHMTRTSLNKKLDSFSDCFE